MKTIFDKIDPKYVECTSGVCEHASHNVNAIIWVIVAFTIFACIYKHDNKNNQSI